MDGAINGDTALRATAATAEMDWAPSPSKQVWRKRVHLVGPPESGQVTSVVRYEPNSSFPPHDHPEGEEILVLDGVFSDEHGDWPKDTFLLNPEGFRHAPFSKEGCVLFVKLRQFPGRDRIHVAVNTNRLDWEPTSITGVDQKELYQQRGFSDVMHLEHWAPGTDRGRAAYELGAELFVLSGELTDETGVYSAGHWLRLPSGSEHHPSSQVLILGSMPGKASLAANQYYAHPRNAFWKIVERAFDLAPESCYSDRIGVLTARQVALWDVLKTCTRESSLDSDIVESSVVPNNFESFFESHPDVSRVYFNGAKAEKSYAKHVLPTLGESIRITYVRLPSTSPANASMTLEDKISAWKCIAPRIPKRR
jgi:hypoxanthine-DNA glycosylase